MHSVNPAEDSSPHLEDLEVHVKTPGLKIARDPSEYLRDIFPKEPFLTELKSRGMDLFTFIERSWCYTIYDSPYPHWVKDNVALTTFESYQDWIKKVTKITPNNPTNRARKRGVTLEIASPDEKLAQGIANVYNETPIRQNRRYPFYGTPPQAVAATLKNDKNTIYVTANFNGEIIGFMRIEMGDNLGMINQGVSMDAHMDKGVTRALFAKCIEVAAERGQNFVMYGRIGNHPSLDRFKRLNGFEKCEIKRFYIPLTRKGAVALRLGLERDLKDSAPNFIKKPLYPVYNFVSRAGLSYSDFKRRHFKK
jgi:hypothetical protein